MFKFTLHIAGTDYTKYVTYPLSLILKNLDDSLNIVELTLSQTPFAAPIAPNQKALIQIEENGVVKRTIPLLTMADSVKKLGRRNRYNHKMAFIEYTYFLEQRILPDSTITRIQGQYEPTLKDVAEKILKISNINILLSPETSAILDSVVSPEWTFARRNVLEALRLVFMMARIVPTMSSFSELGHISIEGDFIDSEFLEKFGAYERAYDPETYKTAVKTNLTNLVLEEDVETVVEPKNGWISTRSPSDFEISNDDSIIPTTRPINRITDVKIRLNARYLVQ